MRELTSDVARDCKSHGANGDWCTGGKKEKRLAAIAERGEAVIAGEVSGEF